MSWLDGMFSSEANSSVVAAALSVLFPRVSPATPAPAITPPPAASLEPTPAEAEPPTPSSAASPAKSSEAPVPPEAPLPEASAPEPSPPEATLPEPPSPPPPPPPTIPGLDRALRVANPKVDQSVWLPALAAAMIKAEITTARRIAAFLGQVSQEAGSGFRELEENLNYTHAERIRQVFPDEFPTISAAQVCVGHPERLANICYAHKLGNGGPESGDGWKFCGRGLIQLTGRSEYTQFANAIGRSVDDAADYCKTPEGAAASACWYWTSRKINPLADAWDLAAVTRRINGNAMEGHIERVAMAEAALKALGD